MLGPLKSAKVSFVNLWGVQSGPEPATMPAETFSDLDASGEPYDRVRSRPPTCCR